MRLTTFTDYALRVLMYAGMAGERLITIEETAKVYGISRTHLMKVVNILTKGGYLEGIRGRSGGFRLAMAPDQINLGAVMRMTEPDFGLVECFTPGNQCIISRCCRLPNILNEALNSFVATLDCYTLADLVFSQGAFDRSLASEPTVRGPDFLAADLLP